MAQWKTLQWYLSMRMTKFTNICLEIFTTNLPLHFQHTSEQTKPNWTPAKLCVREPLKTCFYWRKAKKSEFTYLSDYRYFLTENVFCNTKFSLKNLHPERIKFVHKYRSKYRSKRWCTNFYTWLYIYSKYIQWSNVQWVLIYIFVTFFIFMNEYLLVVANVNL